MATRKRTTKKASTRARKTAKKNPLSIRKHSYQGVAGYLVSGKDAKGRAVSIHVNTKRKAESIKAAAKKGDDNAITRILMNKNPRKRNTTIIKAKKIGRVIIRKKPSVANPYAYQIQFQRPGEKVQYAGAYYTSSRADALKQAETDLKRRKLWKPKTKLITGAVPLNSTAARHVNPNGKQKASKKVRKLRESFTGLKSRQTAMMNAPKGTPANLAKLGKLISIKAAKGTIRPGRRNPSSTVWLCADARGKLHLCTTGDRLIDGPAQSFGEIREIEYEAIKPHLGHARPTIFFHRMAEEGGKRPELRADGSGGLKITGGSYYITPEGIRD